MSDLDLPPELDFGIDLASVKARLEQMTYFLSVGEISAASEAMDGTEPAYPPAAFVSIYSELPEPNKLIGGNFRQRVRVGLSVLFVESTVRADNRQGDRIEKTKRAIVRQLVNWTPTGAERHLEYGGYALRAIGGGLVWGECKFPTEYFLSNPA